MVKTLGVLMLETRFERVLGDIGNPGNFDFPVVYRTVSGATSQRVVLERDDGLIELFSAAAMDLIEEGATAITTSCGFLAEFQDELAARIPVPFTASALNYLVALDGRHARVGVLTADADALHADVLPRGGISPEAIVGLEDAVAFRSAIIDQTAELDAGAIEREVLAAARRLNRDYPDLDAIILECTNLPPYRSTLERVFTVPIYDSLTLVEDLMSR